MSTPKHIDYFLESLDIRGTILNRIQEICEVAQKDKGSKDSIKFISNWTNERVKKLTGTLHPTATELLHNQKIMMLLGALYLKYEVILKSSKLSAPLIGRKITIKETRKFLSTIESDFIDQLYLQLVFRSNRDSNFSGQLKIATDDVFWVISNAMLNKGLVLQLKELNFLQSGNTEPRLDNDPDVGFILVTVLVAIFELILVAAKVGDNE